MNETGHTRSTIRIFRHPLTDYYRGDLANVGVYTPAFFSRLRDDGFNATWLHLPLHHLVPFRAAATAAQQANAKRLATLAERASRQGVRVYLYMNEPRARSVNDPFWERFPEARGEPGKSVMDGLPRTFALCTSTSVGRDYIRECARALFRRIPELGGAFLITASEHHTHCYSHVYLRKAIEFASDTEHAGLSCPRCRARHPCDVVAEMLNLFRDGVRAAGSRADVIAWNWSWNMYAPDPQPAILRPLKPDIILMADFERGGVIRRGIRQKVEEYSLSYVGPSPRFTRLRKAAVSRGHGVMAKLQLGVTHELATVPNLPLLGNIWRKLQALRTGRARGFVGCWNFGSFPSLNTAAAGFELTHPTLSRARFMKGLFQDYFGMASPERLIQAITGFERSFRHYPLHNRFLYWGPLNFAPGIPIALDAPCKTPLTETWLDRPRGNDWDRCLGDYTLDQVLVRLDRMIRHWDAAFGLYADGLFPGAGFGPLEWGRAARRTCIPLDGVVRTDDDRLRHLRRGLPAAALQAFPLLRTVPGLHRLEEWCSAFAAGACLRSGRHTLQAHKLHKQRKSERQQTALRRVAQGELELIENLRHVMRLDARIGFHGEAQAYLFSERQLEKKTRALRQIAR